VKHTLAIIGYGGMGGFHHNSIKEKVGCIRVKGAFDIRPEAMAKAREAGLHAYGSLDELLADQEVDLITVATPNDVHRPLVIRCLEAGKNVVCEKPVALNAAELKDMIAASRRTGKLFSVHQNRRWDRDYRIVVEAIRSGMIGKPYFIESRVQGSHGSVSGWRGQKQHGGGMLLDWGVHMLDQLMDMTPEPVIEVSACLQKVFGGEVDDNIKVNLRFGNGLSALMEMATNCFISLPRWHISGTEGTLIIHDWDCGGQIVQSNNQRFALPDEHPDWSEYYINIADTLDGKAQLIVKPEQALRVMRVIDTIFAAEEQRGGISCQI